jgi:succinoglycan biosynthesis transport protein ExoP
MTESTDQGIALHQYLRVIRRRKWIIVAAVVLVPLVAVVHAVRQPAVYEASAKVLLSRESLANTLTGSQDQSVWMIDEPTFVKTQADVARVPAIAQAVVSKLGVSGMTPGQFLGESSVATAENSQILTFSVQDTDPALAARAASIYAEQYTRYRHEHDTASLEAARRGVADRMAHLVATGQGNSPLYDSLAKREQELQTMEALQTSNASVIQVADGAAQVSPHPVRDGALGLVLGMVLGLGLAFLREGLDTRVRNANEVGERLGLPLLGRIPEPPKKLRDADRLVMVEEPTGIHAEAFRMLRTNLEFAMLDHDIRTIMLTSAVAAEGKSTTAANLALAFARSGRHVVLVDLDLRKPRLDRFFGLSGKRGIAEVVLGRIELDAALARVPILPEVRGRENGEQDDLIPLATSSNGSSGSVEVLTTGQIPPNPGEFVGSNALTKVLARLRDRADLVLIDSPPLLEVGDAMTLSRWVDAVVVIARLQLLRRGTIAETHRLLTTIPAHKLGFVLTAAEAEEGYGYGYGFGRQRYHRPYRREEEPVA